MSQRKEYVDLHRRDDNVIRLALFSVLILAMVFGSFGCGSPEEETNGEKANDEEIVDNDEEENGEEAAENEEEMPVAAENWQNPTESDEVLEMFEELEWTFTRFQDGDIAKEEVVTYVFEGTDTVDGVETELISFDYDDEKLKIWIDEDGNSVQGEYQGHVFSGPLLQSTLDEIVRAMFAPFKMVENIGLQHFLAGDYPGVEWKTTSTQREDIGAASAEVTEIELYLVPPMVQEGRERTVSCRIGDFGDFQIVIEWIDDDDRSDYAMSYRVTNIVPR